MNLLLTIGRIAGVVGALVCVLAFVVRASGRYLLDGVSVGVLFQGGAAAMIAGCFCLLWVVAARR